MKTFVAALAGAVLLSGVAVAKETTSTLKVSGWHCEGCSEKTAAAVKKVKGVKDATVDFDKKKLTVVYDDELTHTSDITRAVAELHYKAAVLQ